MSHISNVDLTECEQIAPRSDAVDEFPVAMSRLAEQHRPSRMPFFRNLATLDHAAASDPAFLGQIHLVYQAAMHATRVAVYYLPHLDSQPCASASFRYLSTTMACRAETPTIIN